MAQRILVMAFTVVLFLGASSFGQENKTSRSPSDIPVDQIKKAIGKAKAANKATDNQSAPKPVAEGTPVAQPVCQSGKRLACTKRNRNGHCGRLMQKVRCFLGRRCTD
ncbi:MAG: hypothetical protein VX438_19315 [Planctomycetota bacterium]|nr:hypothetical protein [Planctomycetota bacterium]